eukprot:3274274-Amphidinium_carterae.1
MSSYVAAYLPEKRFEDNSLRAELVAQLVTDGTQVKPNSASVEDEISILDSPHSMELGGHR